MATGMMCDARNQMQDKDYWRIRCKRRTTRELGARIESTGGGAWRAITRRVFWILVTHELQHEPAINIISVDSD